METIRNMNITQLQCMLATMRCDFRKDKGKVEVHPVTGHWGPEGWVEVYSPTLSRPRHLDGGGWSASRPGRFTPGKDPVPIVQEAG